MAMGYRSLVLAVIVLDGMIYSAAYLMAGERALGFFQIFGVEWLGALFQSVMAYVVYMYFYTLLAPAMAAFPMITPRCLLSSGLVFVRSHAGRMLFGCFVSAATLFCISSCAQLVELYRWRTENWNDPTMWGVEGVLLEALSIRQEGILAVFDFIYFRFWVFLMVGLGVITHHANAERQALFTIAIILSFFIMRGIALAFPTQGPAFYRPDMFVLLGTLSGDVQRYLEMFMSGMAPQYAGLYPGTMAMPSLHVGLTALTAWFIYRELPWTIWLCVPWFILSWVATVVLGWHYISDGVVALLVVSISYRLGGWYLKVCKALGDMARTRGAFLWNP